MLVVAQWVGRGRSKLIPMKYCLKKRGLDARQVRRMVHDRSRDGKKAGLNKKTQLTWFFGVFKF